jgi:hypothetical protein
MVGVMVREGCKVKGRVRVRVGARVRAEVGLV